MHGLTVAAPAALLLLPQDFPVSGGGYTFTLLSFGELPAWITGSNLVLLYTVVMAGVRPRLLCGWWE